jgi:acyl carrier protein
MSTMRVGNLNDSIQAIRLANNPIVHPQKMGLEGEIGKNINGSSLIKVPDWIQNPLGRYYLYFAHHRGQFIRLAYADRIDGLWQIYKPGTLQIEQTNCFDHIASPDVHIDEEKQEIQMYFHGCSREKQQVTMLAISKDGLQFNPSSEVLGPFYFRVFQYGGYHYALAKNYNIGGILLRSRNGRSNFEVGLPFIPNLRHTAVLVQGNKLIVFYSKIGDAPECILMSWVDLTKDWKEWRPSPPIVILKPEMDYEGVHLPIQPSVPGLAKLPVRQLRDPAIYEENRQIYLLYSVAGEQGIAIAKLNLNSDLEGIANITPKEKLVQNTSSLWQTIRSNVQRQHRTPSIRPVARDRPIPLSFAQERLWQLHQLNPKNTAHHLQAIIRLQGKLNLTALEQSFCEIARRHEILRTTFPSVEGQPVQMIAADTDFQLKTIDLQHLSDTEQNSAIERSISSMRNEPFDLAIGPLWRVQLLHLREDDYLLIRVTHHIIFDGWSGTVFRQELTRLYAGFNAGQSASLPPLNIQYADYAAWQRQTLNEEAMSSQYQYWQQQLSAPIAPLELPLDRPRPPFPSHEGSQQTLTLSPELTRSLKQLSHQEGVSLFVTLLAAFQALLFGYTQQTDLLMCSPVANRSRPELKKLMGYFNNLLLLRTDLSGNPTGRDLLHRVSQVVLAAQEHQDLPLEAIAEFPHLAPIPFNRAMFALQNLLTHPLELAGMTVRGLHREQTSADFDLFLSMREREGQLEGQLKYRTALFEATTIAQMLENFQAVLESWVVHPGHSIDSLPVRDRKSLPAPDWQQQTSTSFVAPRNAIEQQLAEIWKNVLCRETPVGIHDNFFDLGGHSLMAIQAIVRVRDRFQVGITPRHWFESPTVAELAAIIETWEQREGEPFLPKIVPRSPQIEGFSQNKSIYEEGEI